ncbi:MAG: flagellar biosynthesis protein FlgB [Acetobacteraceae bacterium]|nr:flagellar biosynthesis protein FlgB [Acetobacteraceae bacterium]
MDAPRPSRHDLMERRLAWIEQRQRVLAENVSNADTPGFRPRDVTPFREVLQRTAPELARTSDRHLRPAGDPQVRRDRQAAEVAPNGNAVSLDREALRIAETDQAHALTLGLQRRWGAMYRTALGRGS